MAVASNVGAYELATHADISANAADISDLGIPTTLGRLGLRPYALDDKRQLFYNSVGRLQTITDLMQFGARWEDDMASIQALRHFYDPAFDRALDIGGPGQLLVVKSPDWTLEDSLSYAAQTHSYRDTRNYLYAALTDPIPVTRRRTFGLMFQSIGHLIHHLQDMSQPQHVRSDPHCDVWPCDKFYHNLYAPSQYEKYTDLDSPTNPLQQIRRNLPYFAAGSSPVYPGVNPATTPFRKPRDFWRTTPPNTPIDSGAGIAEYTNRNFYSDGTIHKPYLSPRPPTLLEWFTMFSEAVDVRDLLPGTPLRGKISFIARPVADALAGTEDTNERAASAALLDSDLAQIYSTTGASNQPVFALNRFTFDAAHHYLIPRAVAYSAGFINYLFRGQLEMRHPDEGAYAILDHALDNRRNVDGFRRLKVKLRNITSGGTDAMGNAIIEPIPDGSGGTFVAIGKFHLNGCYESDLSGEYGSPGIDWRSCRLTTEEMVVSAPIPVPLGINDALQPVVFDFSPNLIPINATDIYLQVVYRGPLGEEADSIIVATKDISEPTYNYMFTTWDQSLFCADGVISGDPPCPQVYTFEQSFCQQAAPELTLAQCRARHGRTTKVRANPVGSPLPGFDPENPAVPPDEVIYDMLREPSLDPLFALPTPVGSFTRVAVLTDLEPSDPYVVVTEQGVADMAIGFSWSEGPGVPTINQLDPTTDTMIKNRSYGSGRGVFVDATPYDWNPSLSDVILLNSGSAPSIPPLNLVPSQIMSF